MSLLPLVLLVAAVSAPGRAHAATCTASGVTLSTTTCTQTAPNYNNYISRQLTYSNGIFTGTLTTNGCPKWAVGYNNGVNSGVVPSPTCTSVTLPSETAPAAVPLKGNIGYSVRGANIYNGLDNGFTGGGVPDVCTNHLGTCAAGTPVDVCFNAMEVLCGTSALQRKYGLDSCNGHAQPYHVHADLVCEYNQSAAGHSTLTGFALDGRGIYGKYETTGVLAVVDACGGHWGNVPAYTDTDTDGTAVSYAAGTNVYHYHTSLTGTTTLSCYGPPSGATSSNLNDMSTSACTSLYTGQGYCSSATTTCTSVGSAQVYLWCPCMQYKGTAFNNITTVTTACPACTNDCAEGGGYAVTPSPTSTPTPTPTPTPAPTPSTSTASPSPSPPPPANTNVRQVEYSFNTDYNTLAANFTKLAQFTSDVATNVATAAGVSFTSVTVTSVKAGSVVVDVQVTYPATYSSAQADAAATTLAASASSTFSSTFTSTYSITGTVTATQISSSSGSGNKLSTGAIVGIAVGGGVGLILVILLIVLLVRKSGSTKVSSGAEDGKLLNP